MNRHPMVALLAWLPLANAAFAQEQCFQMRPDPIILLSSIRDRLQRSGARPPCLTAARHGVRMRWKLATVL